MCHTPASITATVLSGTPSRCAASAVVSSVTPLSARRAEPVLAVAVRARADGDSTAVGVLRRGEPFTASVTDGAWLHVTTASGITGWVDDGDLRRDGCRRPN
ncbi:MULTISPECIES: SH3 domain-containing protein [Streptomyces]|uniref:SH3 domain-containing protein n=1 Tax=Streptomyces TaxID=1883 RepID=UPI00225225D6|nr:MULTISPECIES: SH3 domain-containing protein [Streptomyces]MCX4807023.1 SH3 domain-containing protein [Streptomyces sp. NBC_01214]MCX5274975.1 SH3 domain-containing protein [Streptomyces virginiae]WSQ01927.1 SH3 domain-containing protein [Streptomyces sp. NBC_01232]